ncbi:unnamed protein product [Lymnaea stagnalis]|uniref:Uncharacterized protein n=1 Tax=Lymnaea stagnalis TaxID=6523 RepID=A0AAV2IC10_LYMST
MCIKHNGQLSAKELYGVIADVGLKYEMMKGLITKRVHNLEILREKLAAFERSIKSRAELEEKVTYLTASVENVQSLIYSTQDSFSSVLAKNCLTNFKDSWPLGASLDWSMEPSVGVKSASILSSKTNSRANDDALSSEKYVGLSSVNVDLPSSTLEFEGHSSSNLNLISSTLECDWSVVQ